MKAAVESLRARTSVTTLGAYLFCAALLLFASLYSPGFLASGHVRLMLAFASFIGFAALGQTLVILGGGLDLSVPWLVALGGLQLSVWTAGGMPQGVAIVLLLAIGAGVGAISGLGVVGLDIPPIVMTLGVGGVVEAYLLQLSQGHTSSLSVGGFAHDLVTAGIGPIPDVALIWAGVAVLAAIWLTLTATGRRVYAVGSEDTVSRLAGVRVARVRFVTYAISGSASVLTGILLAGYTGQAYVGMGEPYLFASIAAMVIGGGAILGGRGSYWGTIAGALTLVLLEQILPIFNINHAVLSIVYGLAILAGVTVSQGVGRALATRAAGAERAAAAELDGEPAR